MLKKLCTTAVLFAFCVQVWAGQVTGVIQSAGGQAIANATITFTPTQPAVSAGGTFTQTASTVSCYTDALGNVVGMPNPLVAPTAAAANSGTLTAATTYYLQLTYTSASGETVASPENAFFLPGGQTSINITAPLLQPTGATGYKVYAATTSGGEKLQQTVTGFGNTSITSLLSVTSPPASNTTQCTLNFSDSLIPQAKYILNIMDSTGSQVPGYPQIYYMQGSTFNLNTAFATGNTTVIFPQAIVATPSNGHLQSILGGLAVTGPFTATSILFSGPDPWYDVTSYGADNTGLTDSRAAIQAAINAAALKCGTVFLPPGTYLLNSPQGTYGRLLQPKTCVNMKGSGMGSSILKAGPNMRNGVGQGGFFVLGETPDDAPGGIPIKISNVRYSDFTIDDNGTNNLVPSPPTGISDLAINIYDGDNIVIERVEVKNNAGTNDIAIGCQNLSVCNPITAPTNVRLLNNYIHDSGKSVAGNTNQTDHSDFYVYAVSPVISNNRMDNSSLGAGIECHSSGAVVTGNTSNGVNHLFNIVATVNDQIGSVYSSNVAKNALDGGVVGWQATGFNMRDVKVVNNDFEVSNATGSAIDFNSQMLSTNTKPEQILIANNTLRNMDSSQAAATGNGVALGGASGGDYTVEGNTITDFFGPGVGAAAFVIDTFALTMKGNVIRNCGRSSNAAVQNHVNLNSTFRYRWLEITGNTFSNPSLDSPATLAITSNAPILAGRVVGNTTENFTTEWTFSGTLGTNFSTVGPKKFFSALAAGSADIDYWFNTKFTRTSSNTPVFLVQNNGVTLFDLINDGRVFMTGNLNTLGYQTTTNCAGVGTAASPSVVSCGSATAGHFSCATNATGATCQVNTTGVAAGSEIFVFESDTAATGTALGVTCNTSTNVLPASRLLASSVASTSFTINLGTVTTNPACFSYFIVNPA